MEMNASPSRTKLRATMARRSSGRDLNGESLNYDAQPEPNMRLSRAIAIVLLLHIVAVGGVLAFSLIKDRAPQPLTRSKPAPATSASGPVTASTPSPAAASNGGNTTAAAKRNEPVTGTPEKKLSVAPTSTTQNAAAKPKTTTHVVRVGETLARVASENSVSLGSLIAVNDARVTTANLKPGQEIQIPLTTAPKERAQDEATRLIEANGPPTPPKSAPAKSAPTPNVAKALPVTPPSAPVAAAPANAKAAAKPVESADKTYVVAAGDNPNKLAKKFGVSETALLKANGIEDPRKLRIGQQLIIPARKAK